MSEKKGGRKKASEAMPQLENNFKATVTDHTAGDPMREDVIWTYLSSTEIARELDRLGTRRSRLTRFVACSTNSVSIAERRRK